MHKTAFICDPRFADHDTGPAHPERRERITAIRNAVEGSPLTNTLITPHYEPIDPDLIRVIHPGSYVDDMRQVCEQGVPYFMDPECAVCPESYNIALLAAGAVLGAVDAVMSGEIDNGFCAVRPPGHHAEANRAMGFCFFNNIAVAARYLQQHHSVERIGILDYDVHHGNGTQHSFDADPTVLFCSMHEHPRFLYPGTGYTTERGTGPGKGTTRNIPMMPGASNRDYEQAFVEWVEPFFQELKPQFLLVDVGFDAHRADPLAHIDLTDDGYEMLARRSVRLADQLCNGRLVSMLEGGYDLPAVGRCTVRHLSALQGKNP
ncbi:MAG: histone deacetylase [Phycisphaerales bacterium]|nr:MAG: histone deacetylase [Phycisphaerales bacterium]